MNRLFIAWLVILCAVPSLFTEAADLTATSGSNTSGLWTATATWGGANYPNNDQPSPGDTWTARITGTNGIVTLNTNITLRSLSLIGDRNNRVLSSDDTNWVLTVNERVIFNNRARFGTNALTRATLNAHQGITMGVNCCGDRPQNWWIWNLYGSTSSTQGGSQGFDNYGTINNYHTFVVNASANGSFDGAGGVFNNKTGAVLRISVANVSIGNQFNNEGLLDISNVTLTASSCGIMTGQIVIASGGTLAATFPTVAGETNIYYFGPITGKGSLSVNKSGSGSLLCIFKEPIDVSAFTINASAPVFSTNASLGTVAIPLNQEILCNQPGIVLTAGRFNLGQGWLRSGSAYGLTTYAATLNCTNGMNLSANCCGPKQSDGWIIYVSGPSNSILSGTDSFYQSGIFVVMPGHTLEIRGHLGNKALTGTGLVTNYGTIVKNDVVGTGQVDNVFANLGTLRAETGQIYFNGGFTQGMGGRIEGTAEIRGNMTINGGQVSPGLSAGKLTLYQGNVTLAAAVTNIFELGGTTPVTEFDVLSKTGTGTLNLNSSALTVQFTGGFESTVSKTDTFDIITCDGSSTLSGSFGNLVSGRVEVDGGLKGSFAVTITSGAGGKVQLNNYRPPPARGTVFFTR